MVLYCISLVGTEISILLLYCSIFPGKGFALAARIVGGFALAWGIASILSYVFACRPVQGFWDLTIDSQCIDRRDLVLGIAVVSIVMDIVILALPMRDIWGLQVTTKQKLAVLGMFLLGGFVCVSSGIRLFFLMGLNQQDFTWNYCGVNIWSIIEVTMAVISGCLPTLRPVTQAILHYLRTLISSIGVSVRGLVSSPGFSSKEAHHSQDGFHLAESSDSVGKGLGTFFQSNASDDVESPV